MGRPRSATTGFVPLGAPGYRPLQGGPEPTRGWAQVRDLEDLRAEEDTAPIKLRTCCGVPTFRVIAAFLVVGGLAVLALLSVQDWEKHHPHEGPGDGPPAKQGVRITVGDLAIEQVDYEGFLKPGFLGMPALNLTEVDMNATVVKSHRSVVMENEFVRVVVLPEMGRVYSLVSKVTGHETLWRNDVARPGGANNKLGWWLWIGGIEYTLPGEEHGYTWALPWDWEVVETAGDAVAVKASVTDPSTGLEETVVWGLERGKAALATDITIVNPSNATQTFAHWVNPQWAPGGQNRLSNDTELVIPTKQVLIPERWQDRLGPSPQAWPTCPLRTVGGWGGMGDFLADGLDQGYYGLYSHAAEEGVLRVFDPQRSPGLDVWTYGNETAGIPGEGTYAEMWGGTVTSFPDERGPLAAGADVAWREWIVPFQKIGGASFANQHLALKADLDAQNATLAVRVCPTRRVALGSVAVTQGAGDNATLLATDWFEGYGPAEPLARAFDLGGSPDYNASLPVTVTVLEGVAVLGVAHIHPWDAPPSPSWG